MTKLLLLFIVLNIVNVVLNTIKNIITVKGGKIAAAAINAITFFVYTYVLIYTNSDLPMFTKAIIVAACNFVGVYVVKWIEAKIRKDKLWRVEMTINSEKADALELHRKLDEMGIPNHYVPHIGKYTLFSCYCATQKESALVREIANEYDAKYFVTETKEL